MDPSEYKEMALKIRAELEALEIHQEDTERRIARLKQALIGLIPLSEPPDNSSGAVEVYGGIRDLLESMSLSDAARQIFQAAKAPLTPTEVKGQLLSMGRDLGGQKNIMASIHSLLKRLVASGEIETGDNGLTYQWKPKYFDLGIMMGAAANAPISPEMQNGITHYLKSIAASENVIPAVPSGQPLSHEYKPGTYVKGQKK